MDLSNPFGTLVTREMKKNELARAISQDIAAELDAAALYQAHIDATDDERAKAVLAHIRDEEKEHVAEFMKLLEMLDPIQAAKMADRDNDINEILSTAGIDISMEGTISNSDEEQAPEPGAMT
jgi:rubrerythrin